MSDSETSFTMDPEQTLRNLARQLVSGQRTLVALQRSADAARRGPDSPELRKVTADLDALRRSWYAETLPHIMAGMQLALEVFDTSGPGECTSDGLDAAVWNNKFFVWVKELVDAGPAA